MNNKCLQTFLITINNKRNVCSKLLEKSEVGSVLRIYVKLKAKNVFRSTEKIITKTETKMLLINNNKIILCPLLKNRHFKRNLMVKNINGNNK